MWRNFYAADSARDDGRAATDRSVLLVEVLLVPGHGAEEAVQQTLTKAGCLDSLAQGAPKALVEPDPECALGELRRRSQLADEREMSCWRWAGCGI